MVVADGFTGNVALKAIEGTAKLYTQFVRDAFRTSTFAKIGYLFASGAWVKLRKRVDPRRYNGGVFLGLDGVCVKSHGGTDALGFAYAIGVAVDLVRYEYKNKLVDGLGNRLTQLRRAEVTQRRVEHQLVAGRHRDLEAAELAGLDQQMTRTDRARRTQRPRLRP